MAERKVPEHEAEQSPVEATAAPVVVPGELPSAGLASGASLMPGGLSAANVQALQRAAGNEAVSSLLRQTDGAAAAPPPPGAPAAPVGPATPGSFIAPDDAQDLRPGQVRKAEFVVQLRAAVDAVVDETVSGMLRRLAAQAAVAGWFAEQASRPAAELERSLLQAVSEAQSATGARDYITIVTARVRREVIAWESDEEQQGSEGGGPQIMPKLAPGSPPSSDKHDPVALAGRLGGGRPLDPSTSGQLGGALGRDLSAVRVHDDAAGADVAGSVGARAVTIGEHVAFASGEFRPGTPEGGALLAHELAHVGQQADAGAAGLEAKGAGPDSQLEQEADTVAAGAMLSLWGGLRGSASELRRMVKPRLRSGLRLQSCNGKTTPVASAAPPVPTTHGPDQHAGVHLPDAATQRRVLNELSPGSFDPAPVAPPPGPAGPVPAPPTRIPWDGATGQANFAAKRTQLKNELNAALVAHLNGVMPGIRTEATRPRLPIASFEGPGRGAKRTVDGVFGSFKAAAALSAAARHGVTFAASGPGQNLFDANDPADRTKTGVPLSADSVSFWMAQHDPAANAINERHHFDPGEDGSEAQRFLTTEVLPPFVTAHRADLLLYDQWGFALAPSGTGVGRTVVTPTTLAGGLSTAAGAHGEPSPAERATRWNAFQILVHEYIHTLAHPSFDESRSAGGGVMAEGFCEMFTGEVLDSRIAGAGADAALRAEVEGSPATPAPTADILPHSYTSPDTYAADRTHAENIRGMVGPEAVRAAYFQGHIEYLGLQPGGAGSPAAPAAAGAADQCSVPGGVTSLAQLATASGVPEADIRAANPGQTFAGPLPARLNLPGCRNHRVVSTPDRAAGTNVAETREQIAAQNGVSEADLVRANPSASWAALHDGDNVLIPRH